MKLKEMREKARLTLRELSEITGVSIQQLSRYERGEVKPSAEALLSIAKAYNISVEKLMNEESAQSIECNSDLTKDLSKEDNTTPINRLIRVVESQQEVIRMLVNKLN